jgi:hypothetical protein
MGPQTAVIHFANKKLEQIDRDWMRFKEVVVQIVNPHPAWLDSLALSLSHGYQDDQSIFFLYSIPFSSSINLVIVVTPACIKKVQRRGSPLYVMHIGKIYVCMSCHILDNKHEMCINST